MAKAKRSGWYTGWRKATVRVLILAVAAGTILAIGMARYRWKPLGLTWEQVTRETGESARPVADAVGSAVESVGDAVGERIDRTLGEATDAGDELIRATTDAVGDLAPEKKTEPAASAGSKDEKKKAEADEDREALDRLLEEKGL